MLKLRDPPLSLAVFFTLYLHVLCIQSLIRPSVSPGGLWVNKVRAIKLNLVKSAVYP